MDQASWEAVEAVGTWVAAIITFVMAGVTAFMAYLTREAVEESKKQRYEARHQFDETRKREAQQHQDQFRPLLVVVPPGDGAATDRMGFVTTSDPNETQPSVFVKCTVQNIGVGPALNVRLSVRKDERTGFGPARELAPIARNDTLHGSEGPFRLGHAGDRRVTGASAVGFKVRAGMLRHSSSMTKPPTGRWQAVIPDRVRCGCRRLCMPAPTLTSKQIRIRHVK